MSDDNDNNGSPPPDYITPVIAILAIVLIGGLVLAGLENAASVHLGKEEILDTGPLLFGVVLGWVTYRTLRRDGKHAHISDIAAVVSALGGTAVTGLVDKLAIGWYLTGLFDGFFLFYLVHGILPEGKDKKIRELLIGSNKEGKKDTSPTSSQ